MPSLKRLFLKHASAPHTHGCSFDQIRESSQRVGITSLQHLLGELDLYPRCVASDQLKAAYITAGGQSSGIHGLDFAQFVYSIKLCLLFLRPNPEAKSHLANLSDLLGLTKEVKPAAVTDPNCAGPVTAMQSAAARRGAYETVLMNHSQLLASSNIQHPTPHGSRANRRTHRGSKQHAAGHLRINPRQKLPHSEHSGRPSIAMCQSENTWFCTTCTARCSMQKTQSRNLPTEFFSLHISPHGVRLERRGLLYRVRTG